MAGSRRSGRLRPGGAPVPARARSAVRPPRDDDADAYLRAIVARPHGGLATSVQRIKGLVVFCYYEQPEVKEQLGYRPDGYIAEVSRRRLSRYGAQIRAGEVASLGPDPDGPDVMNPPDARGDRS